MKNYYDLLEVSPKASKEIIERAYKVLIKQCHPDNYIGEEKIYAEEKTRELNEAYHILSDDFLRNQYDLELQKEKESQNRNTNYNNYNRFNNQGYNNQQNNLNNQYNFNNPNQYNDSNYNNYNQNQYNQGQEQPKQHKVGTFMAMVDVFNAVFRKRENGPKVSNKIEKKDITAGIMAIAIVVVVLIILWFVPFTHSFVAGLNPF